MRSKLKISTMREIKSTFGRFMAILAIIALGVGFFSGVKITTTAMVNTVGGFMNNHELFDYRIVSALGWEEQDVEALREHEDVRAAEGAYALDLLVNIEEDNDLVFKTHSLTDGVNVPEILEGRLPESISECVIDGKTSYQTGDILVVSEDNSEDTLSNFKPRELTVVGRVYAPSYVHFERGTTSLGSGSVNGYIYLNKDAFDMDIYTELYVKLNHELDVYSDEYNDYMSGREEGWELAAEEQAANRYDRIISDGEEELADGRKELEEARADGKQELDDARAELDDARDELEEAEQKLIDAEQEIEEGKKEIADNEQILYDSKKTLYQAEEELRSGKEELDIAEETLAASKTEIDENEKKLENGESALAEAQGEIDSGMAQISAAQTDIDNASEQIAAGQAEIDMGAEQIAGAQAEIDAGMAQIAAGQSDINAQTEVLEKQYELFMEEYGQYLDILDMLPEEQAAQIIAGKEQVDKGFAQLTAAQAELDAQSKQLAAAKAELDTQSTQLAAAQKELDIQAAQLAAAQKELDEQSEKLYSGQAELDSKKADLDKNRKLLEDGMAQYYQGYAEYSEALQRYSSGRMEYDDGLALYNDGIKQLEDGRAELEKGERDYEDGKAEYEEGLKKYKDGEKEYQDGLAEFNEEIADAEQELAEGEQELRDLSKPEVFLLDRNTNAGYALFENDSEIVEQIARVFPIFFILVAALVCMTTMSRMVEERRTQIGTLKALGFSDWAIMGKFMFYAGSAAVIGCVLGYGVGTVLFPRVIWMNYKPMYIELDMKYFFDWKLALTAVVVSLICSVGAAWLSCRYELNETAAGLMRPKAPKAGKRVLLERIPFIWNRMKFLHKVTVRNIFRYKKRFFMMILGIGGCTALLLTGFGLKDSVSGFANAQYEEIVTADASVDYSTDENGDMPADVGDKLEELGAEYACVYAGAWDLVKGDVTKSVSLIAPVDFAELDGSMNFMDTDGAPLETPARDEALVSVSVAERYDVNAGDEITLRDENMRVMNFTVKGVFDNHVYNYIFVSHEDMERQLGEPIDLNEAYVNFHGEEDVYQAQTELAKLDNVTNINIYQDMKKSLTDSMSSLDYVVLLVIICAAGLAFIVLYNLTNINITEREREIATIKVLGFFKKETSAYVLRENIVLTALGIAVGLGLGVLLHRFVMEQIVVDMVSFKVCILPMSFVYSIVLTFLFNLTVNLVMGNKLERINMAESLKSVE